MKERRDVTRTKKSIEHAYLELLFRKGCGRITVNEVIDLADVSRGTFYAHYRDIPDLEEKVSERVTNSLRAACEAEDSLSMKEITEIKLKDVFELFYSMREDFKALLAIEDNSKMLCKIRTVLKDAIEDSSIRRRSEAKMGRMKAEMLCENIAGSIVDSFVFLMRHEEEMGKGEAVSFMTEFISGGIEKCISAIEV
ncbi:MAG: TetR/AcrR family transcriptional regulator [Lachnospiraceae bacterium]|nr:TetR/AcrR family transcriptional regulator [Lachnospiraceae bacterium]